MMLWRASLGAGSRPTRPLAKRGWAGKRPGRIRQTGEKKGVKRHLQTDGRGVPLSLVVTGANVNDNQRLDALLDGIVVRRPRPRRGRPQTMCLDKGYDSKQCRRSIRRREYRDGIKSRGVERLEKQRKPGKRARRWVVERTLSWLNNWRKILIRYERKVANYVGLLHIACAIIALRCAHVLG